jgi:hypothetical protein
VRSDWFHRQHVRFSAELSYEREIYAYYHSSTVILSVFVVQLFCSRIIFRGFDIRTNLICMQGFWNYRKRKKDLGAPCNHSQSYCPEQASFYTVLTSDTLKSDKSTK